MNGLDAGADDYLVKPFAPEELLARVRALMRRPPVPLSDGILTYKDLSLNLREHLLYSEGNSVTLSRKETAFMELLIGHGGGVVTREKIYAHVWGADSFVESGNIDNYVRLLRRRLLSLNSRLEIANAPRVGYILTLIKRKADD